MSPTFYYSLLLGALVVAAPLESKAAILNHWRFDEVSGLVAADSGGSVANNAVWRDAASTNLSWGPGMIGNAAILTGATGTSNVFDVGSIEADGVTQLTYSVWVKPNLTQTGSGGDLNNKGIFTSGDLTVQRSAGPATNQFWGATWENQTQFRVDSTGTARVTGVYDGTETEPEWIHLAFTWDGTSGDPAAGDEEIKVYVNGVEGATGTRNASEIISDGNWQIGRDRTFGGRTFGGMIDDLVVWDVALDAAQIDAIYQGGLAGMDAIEAVSLPGGDVNGDGDTDLEDFEIIRMNFWQPIAERDQGDLIDNDFIDFADYGRWRQAAQLAGVSELAGLRIPEPSSILLLGAASLLCVCCRRR